MSEKTIEVVMDYREQSSGVAEILLQKYGIKVIRDNLKVGDYLIGNEIVVERKTTSDFAQSIIDGRLFKQTGWMKQNFGQCLFIVEGRNLYETSVGSIEKVITAQKEELVAIGGLGEVKAKRIREVVSCGIGNYK